MGCIRTTGGEGLSFLQRMWTTVVILMIVFLAARVSITLLSPHPVYVDDPSPCASDSSNCARLSIDDAYRMDQPPLIVAAGAEDAFWSTVDDWEDNTSRLTLLHETEDFRHYAAATPVWGFVDDVTISLDRITGEVVMHSESRLGLSDLGVNPERLDGLYAYVA